MIFIGLELLSLGLYILTAFAKRSGKSAEAAIKYYLFGGMSAAFLLFGFSYLYGITGSTNLQHDHAGDRTGRTRSTAAPLLYVALVMIAAGLGFKVAAAPFHLWAPDTYEGAPAPAAAFIASVSKVASFALLISIGAAALHVFMAACHARSSSDHVGSCSEPVYLGFGSAWPLDPGGAGRGFDGARQPGGAGADERAPVAGLLGHCACGLHSAGAGVLFLFAARARRRFSTTSSPTG